MQLARTLPFAMLVLLSQAPAAAIETSDAAIVAVAMPEAQFRAILLRAVFGSQTIAMGVMNLGPKANCALLAPAFNAAIAKNLPAWSANLVRAYRQNVPAETLAKASAAGPQAGAQLLAPYLNAIGEQMQKDSEPLLTSAAAETLKPVFDAASSVNVASLNQEARKAEVSAAMADGSLLCGLVPEDGKQS